MGCDLLRLDVQQHGRPEEGEAVGEGGCREGAGVVLLLLQLRGRHAGVVQPQQGGRQAQLQLLPGPGTRHGVGRLQHLQGEQLKKVFTILEKLSVAKELWQALPVE